MLVRLAANWILIFIVLDYQICTVPSLQSTYEWGYCTKHIDHSASLLDFENGLGGLALFLWLVSTL